VGKIDDVCPTIPAVEMADLVITDVWSSDEQLCYRIENVGESMSTTFTRPITYCNALFIDGEKVAEDCIHIALGQGEYVEGCFDYDWQITPPRDIIRVCADFGEDIAESDESNNCLERIFIKEFPDLVTTDAWSSDGQLCYRIQNIGGGMPIILTRAMTYCNALFIDGEKVAEDCINTALGQGAYIDSCFDYDWQITPPYDTIRICADFGEDVTESDEQNNCLEQVFTAPPALPQKACGCFETDRFQARLTPLDGFAVGNLLSGPEAEIITVVDEDASGGDGRFHIYNHEGYEEGYFDARFTHNDRVAIGEMWGRGQLEEIVVAVDEDDKIYVYSGFGALVGSFDARFTKYDCLAVGDVCDNGRDEVVIAIDEDDKVYIYSNQGVLMVEFDIPWDFDGSCNIGDKEDDPNDAMAVGDVFGDEREEIILLDRHGDESQVYIYEVEGQTLMLKMRFPVRFTKYDCLATGDVLGNDKEEILIAIDEDHAVYIYDAVGGFLKLRYARVTPVDGLAAGNVCGGPKAEIVIGIDDDHEVYIASEEA
jgi:hypothetical protein